LILGVASTRDAEQDRPKDPQDGPERPRTPLRTLGGRMAVNPASEAEAVAPGGRRGGVGLAVLVRAYQAP